MSRRGTHSGRGLEFGTEELRDLLIAWVVLSLAFAVFFAGGGRRFLLSDPLGLFGASLLSAGVAFLLHELAHKVVAVRFGQVAAFRADYGMLFLALMSAFAGFIFAAPGAVHHRGRLTPRQRGLIALAGPVTNLALAAVFLPFALWGGPFVGLVGVYGVFINLLLGAFNMLPFGPLDGRKVLDWSVVAFTVVFVPSLLLALGILFPGSVPI
ncbi:metalloprotease [Halobacteriales archaeon QS_1_68_20]|nr:MAG: metalloprotease [Halobacteriales archaeon QS_1_68_20]